MVPILWNAKTTPYPDQVAGNDSERFVSLEAKQEKIKKRCELAGTILREVFNHEQFERHLDRVVIHAQGTAMEMDATRFLAHVWGTLTQVEGHPSSTSSGVPSQLSAWRPHQTKELHHILTHGTACIAA